MNFGLDNSLEFQRQRTPKSDRLAVAFTQKTQNLLIFNNLYYFYILAIAALSDILK